MTTNEPGRPRMYVGYLPLPPGFARPIVFIVGAIMWCVVFASLAIALSRRDPGPGVWETDIRAFEGTLLESPYPMLTTDGGETLLIVRMGKVGAQEDVRGLDGRRVRAHGRILRRDGRRMIELADASEVTGPRVEDVAPGAPRQPMLPDVVPSMTTYVGEIVDFKCYLGAMKPGDGKAHQACATLCIAGGIPPVLVSTEPDGTRTYRVMFAWGKPIHDDLRGLIGVPVEVRGVPANLGNLSAILVSPSADGSLPIRLRAR